jgi:serine/threonine-protein kinase HipA
VSELVTLLRGSVIGRIHDARDRLTFVYEPEWREDDEAHPLSLSMPLAAREHGPEKVEPFLWGLLPDNEQVIERWARKFQVSPRNVFGLLANVGEDCAGAVQFVRPERLEALQAGAEDNVEWLSDQDVAERLRLLREDHAAWRLARDTGQFSLAGAQPKTALLSENGKWGIPSGRIPTTHILKPPTGHFDGHAENEHFCLALARRLGLPTATSRVRQFGNETAIVVERYDRVRAGNEIVRVHQEDACQALGVMPTKKYQNEGGPAAQDIVDLLRTHSSVREEDVQIFVDALAFNWLIGGTDAHAKNYSVLISGGPRVRLAPLYDIASLLPYEQYEPYKTKLSMKIGGEYRIRDIGVRQWRKLAQEARFDEGRLIARVRDMALRLPDEIAIERQRAEGEGLTQPIIKKLADALTTRAVFCQTAFQREG